MITVISLSVTVKYVESKGACFLSFLESVKNINNTSRLRVLQGDSSRMCLHSSVQELETVGNGYLSQQLQLSYWHIISLTLVLYRVCLCDFSGSYYVGFNK